MTPERAAGWRARTVDDTRVASCVALQAESLVNRGVDPAPHVERITRRITAATAGDLLVTVEVLGGCVGFLWASARTLRAPARDTRICHVESIVLTAGARGQGLGSEVLTRLEAAAGSAGFSAVTLNAMADNPRVAGFYARLGYRVVGLDLEKEFAAAAPPAAPDLRRLPWLPAALACPSLGDAFEPGPVDRSVRRAGDGRPIVVLDAAPPATVPDLERAARERGAERVHVTAWGLLDAEALLGLGYRVGRHKWGKSLDLGTARAGR